GGGWGVVCSGAEADYAAAGFGGRTGASDCRQQSGDGRPAGRERGRNRGCNGGAEPDEEQFAESGGGDRGDGGPGGSFERGAVGDEPADHGKLGGDDGAGGGGLRGGWAGEREPADGSFRGGRDECDDRGDCEECDGGGAGSGRSGGVGGVGESDGRAAGGLEWGDWE